MGFDPDNPEHQLIVEMLLYGVIGLAVLVASAAIYCIQELLCIVRL